MKYQEYDKSSEKNMVKYQYIIDRLIVEGSQITQKRQIIIEKLCDTDQVIDLENFWIELRDHHQVSLSTVYCTFSLLRRLGLIHRIEVEDTNNTFYILGLENAS